tara:strand:- start:287 stop:745 length:459 start_codon:yes stop_codon:yes gene_type:complete
MNSPKAIEKSDTNDENWSLLTSFTLKDLSWEPPPKYLGTTPDCMMVNSSKIWYPCDALRLIPGIMPRVGLYIYRQVDKKNMANIVIKVEPEDSENCSGKEWSCKFILRRSYKGRDDINIVFNLSDEEPAPVVKLDNVFSKEAWSLYLTSCIY